MADEVRNLAIRAADTAKNTAGLIEGTVKKVTQQNAANAEESASALKRPSPGKAKALAAPAKKAGYRPEEVLPLNDDDFRTFKPETSLTRVAG